METHEIKALLDSADTLDTQSNEYRWKAAEAIHAQLQNGMSQRQLATEIGRSHTFVRLYNAVWDQSGGITDSTPDFRDCMTQVRAPKEPQTPTPPAPAPEPRPAPRVTPQPEPQPEIPQPSVHDQKAAKAAAHEAFQPLLNALGANRTGVEMGFSDLEDGLERLQESFNTGFLNATHIPQLTAAIDGLILLRVELEMASTDNN